MNSGRFLRKHAIEHILSQLYQDKTYVDAVSLQPVTHRPLLNNQQLLWMLESASSKQGAAFDPLKEIGDPDDLNYYRHRAAALLTHSAWPDRNLGVKLVGLTQYRDKIPPLLHIWSIVRRLGGSRGGLAATMSRWALSVVTLPKRFG